VDYADVSFRFESRQEGEIPVQISTPAGEAGATPAAVCRTTSVAPLPARPSGPRWRSESKRIRASQAAGASRHAERRSQAVGEELFRSSSQNRRSHSSRAPSSGSKGRGPNPKASRTRLRLVLHLDRQARTSLPRRPPLELLYWPRIPFSAQPANGDRAVPEPPRATRRSAFETALRILAVGAFPAGYRPRPHRRASKDRKSWAKLPGVEVEFLDSATAATAGESSASGFPPSFTSWGTAPSRACEAALPSSGRTAAEPRSRPGLSRSAARLHHLALGVEPCNTARSARRGGLDPFAWLPRASPSPCPLAIVPCIPYLGRGGDRLQPAFYAHLAGASGRSGDCRRRQAIRAAMPVLSGHPALFLRGEDNSSRFPWALRHPPRSSPATSSTRHLHRRQDCRLRRPRLVFDAVDQFTHDATPRLLPSARRSRHRQDDFPRRDGKAESHPHHFNLRAGASSGGRFPRQPLAQLITRYGLDYGALPAARPRTGASSPASSTSLRQAAARREGRPRHRRSHETDSAGLIPAPTSSTCRLSAARDLCRRHHRRGRLLCASTASSGSSTSSRTPAPTSRRTRAGRSALAREGIRTYRIAQGLDEAAFVDEMVEQEPRQLHVPAPCAA